MSNPAFIVRSLFANRIERLNNAKWDVQRSMWIILEVFRVIAKGDAILFRRFLEARRIPIPETRGEIERSEGIKMKQ